MIKMTGDIVVYRKDFDGGRTAYSYQISKKDADGTYTNMYKPIQFKKGVEVANKTKIDLVNAWQTFYKGAKGEVDFIMCTEFTILEQGDKPKAAIPEGFEVMEGEDETIPF